MITSNNINMKYCKVNDNNLELDCEVLKKIDSKYSFLNINYFNQPRLIKASKSNEVIFYSPIEFLSIMCYNGSLLDFIDEFLKEEEAKKMASSLGAYPSLFNDHFRETYEKLSGFRTVIDCVDNIHLFINMFKYALSPIYNLILHTVKTRKESSVNLDSTTNIDKLKLKYFTKSINIRVDSIKEDFIIKKMNLSARTIGLLNIDKEYSIYEIERIDRLTDSLSKIPNFILSYNETNNLLYDLHLLTISNRCMFNQLILNYYCYVLQFLERED